MTEPVCLRFTMPHDVARTIDLDGLDRQAQIDGLPPLSYRADTMAGVELSCTTDFIALLLGALNSIVVDPMTVPGERDLCSQLSAQLIALVAGPDGMAQLVASSNSRGNETRSQASTTNFHFHHDSPVLSIETVNALLAGVKGSLEHLDPDCPVLRDAVCRAVDELRAIGLTPERTVLTIREHLQAIPRAHDYDPLRSAIFRWCLERYYQPGDGAPDRGPALRSG